MTDRIYSAFDPAALGAGLELSQSNTIVTVAQTTDINRTARALYGKLSGGWYAELSIWGNGALAGNAVVGIVNSAASIATYVGGDANGWGYKVADGAMFNNGASLGAVAAGDKKQVIGIELVTDGDVDGSLTANWYLQNVLIFSQSLPFAKYFIGVSLASTLADNEDVLNCFLNSGQRTFEYPIRPGWFNQLPLMPAIRFSDLDYIDLPTADVPNAVFDARIKSRSKISLARSLAFWPDKDRSTRSAAMQCSAINSDGILDWIFQDRTSKAPAYVYDIAADGTKQRIATMQYDGGVIQSDDVVQITFQDSIAALELPLQNKLTLPYVLEANANKPWPIVLGAARNVPPLLLDSVNLIYAVSDVPVAGLGYVRDKGDAWNPNATPPDYVMSADRKSFTVANDAAPQGIVTGDFSSVGGGTEPTPANDVIEGYANPFVKSGSSLVGWTLNEPNGGITFDNGWVRFTTTRDVGSLIATSNIIKTAGAGLSKAKVYRYDIEFQFFGVADGIMEATFSVYGGLVAGQPQTVMSWTNREPQFGGNYSINSQRHTGTIVPTQDTPNIGLRFTGTSREFAVKVTKFSMLEVPDIYTPSVITPIKLEPLARQILMGYAKIAVDSYNATSASSIDTASGYSGVGFFAGDEITVRDAMDLVLPSYGACMYEDQNAAIAFLRLEAPEGGTSVAEISASDLLSDIKKVVDDAPGLSTRMGYRKNWQVINDSDFVTDFIEVTRSTRRALSSPCQGIVCSSIQLPSIYDAAVRAEPMYSLLDSKEDAQTEIDRICSIYSKVRALYTVNVASVDFYVGDIVTLTYPRYGLQDGRKLLVKAMVSDLLTGEATVTLWGEA